MIRHPAVVEVDGRGIPDLACSPEVRGGLSYGNAKPPHRARRWDTDGVSMAYCRKSGR